MTHIYGVYKGFELYGEVGVLDGYSFDTGRGYNRVTKWFFAVEKEVWKLNIIPKIQHFLWKVISGAIPTTERLRTRGVKSNAECQCCCLEDESINHMLCECQYSKAVWRRSNIQSFDNPSSYIEENMRILFQIMNTSATHHT